MPSRKSGRENVFQVLKKCDPSTPARNSVERQNALLKRGSKRREVVFTIPQEFLIDGKELQMVDASQINSTFRRFTDPSSQLSAIELYSFVHFPVSVFLVTFEDAKALAADHPIGTFLSQIENQPEEKLTVVVPQAPYKIVSAVCFECDGRKPQEKPSKDAKRNDDDLLGAETVRVFQPFGILVFNTRDCEAMFSGVIYNPTLRLDGMKKALRSCIPSVVEKSRLFYNVRKVTHKKDSNLSVLKKKKLVRYKTAIQKLPAGTSQPSSDDVFTPEEAQEIDKALEVLLCSNETLNVTKGESASPKDESHNQESIENTKPSSEAEATLLAIIGDKVPEASAKIDESQAKSELERSYSESSNSVNEVALRRVIAKEAQSVYSTKLMDDASGFFSKLSALNIAKASHFQQKPEPNKQWKSYLPSGALSAKEELLLSALKAEVAGQESDWSSDEDDTPPVEEAPVEMKAIGQVHGERISENAWTIPQELAESETKVWYEFDANNVVHEVVLARSPKFPRKVWSPKRHRSSVQSSSVRRADTVVRRLDTVRRYKPAAH